MIITTMDKIVDICSEAGFESLSHFYHLFHRKYSMPPNEVRKKSEELDKYKSLVGDPIIETGIPTGVSFLKQTGAR